MLSVPHKSTFVTHEQFSVKSLNRFHRLTRKIERFVENTRTSLAAATGMLFGVIERYKDLPILRNPSKINIGYCIKSHEHASYIVT